MSRLIRWAALATTLGLVGGCNDSPTAPASCDRQCLGRMLDSYLEAVVANDPSRAPLVIGFRQTENAVNTVPGKGVWQSVTALGNLQRRYFDPVTSQAGYFGTVKEGDSTAIVTIRLKVEDDALTEAEWYIARENDPGMSGPRQPGAPPANLHNPEYLEQNPPPQRVVPQAERVDRATLARIVDSYFDAITSHDPSVALVHRGCGRAENGSPAPGGDFLPPAPRRGGPPTGPGAGPQPPAGPAAGGPGAPQPGVGSRDCVAGLENFPVAMVAARRMPLIDEEAQMVLATGVFIRNPGVTTPRNVASWWFVIDEAKIRTTYTAMFYPPPHLAVPNWPPYDGNWPLPATFAPAAPQGR
ncbi:MAG: hypothetical protein DIU62_000675 [Pseudomonadota bacterium]|jgi:hypothetical protein